MPSYRRDFTFCEIFRRCDRFAEPITINHRGKEQYSTVGGGCLTVLITMIILAFATVRVERLVEGRDPTIVTGVEQYRSLDQNKYNLQDHGVDIVVKVDGVHDTTVIIDGEENEEENKVAIEDAKSIVSQITGSGGSKYGRIVVKRVSKSLFEMQQSAALLTDAE